jgi:hypothetical protein
MAFSGGLTGRITTLLAQAAELALLEGAGFRRARLAANILRFETAGVAGLAVVRALLDRGAPPPPSQPPS